MGRRRCTRVGRLFADEMVINLDYAPWTTRSSEAESWTERWSTTVDSPDEAGHKAPTGDIAVSCDDSLNELDVPARRFPQPAIHPSRRSRPDVRHRAPSVRVPHR